MKKLSFLLLSLMLMASSAIAADYGIGINLNEDTRAISVPIDISETFRVEPFYGASNSSADGVTKKYQTQGVGLYLTSKNEETSTLLYYGGKLAIDSYSETDNYDRTGQAISAVIGFEYFFSISASFGGEARYTSGTDSYDPDGKDSYTKNSTYTDSGVFLRYYFK